MFLYLYPCGDINAQTFMQFRNKYSTIFLPNIRIYIIIIGTCLYSEYSSPISICLQVILPRFNIICPRSKILILHEDTVTENFPLSTPI